MKHMTEKDADKFVDLVGRLISEKVAYLTSSSHDSCAGMGEFSIKDQMKDILMGKRNDAEQET